MDNTISEHRVDPAAARMINDDFHSGRLLRESPEGLRSPAQLIDPSPPQHLKNNLIARSLNL
jgi:hypothetical protein